MAPEQLAALLQRAPINLLFPRYAHATPTPQVSFARLVFNCDGAGWLGLDLV